MDNRILVVEDDELTSNMILQVLDSQGYLVETFGRAYGLLERINAFQPNLILMDVELPDGDGRDLCRMIKRLAETKHIMVLMCTGLDDIKEYFKLQAEPDGVLYKPFDMYELISFVEKKLPLAA